MKNLIQQLHKSMQNMHFSAMQSTRFSNVLTPSVLVLFLFLLGVGNVWGATATTVYYAVSSDVVGSYTVKCNVNRKGDGDDWAQYTMTKTGNKYNSKDVYRATFTDLYDGLGKLQFQLYEGDTWKSQVEAISGWKTPTYYNGKIYEYDGEWNDYAINTNATVSAGANGSVSPSGTFSLDNTSGTTITATPNTNYAFAGWTITGGITPSISSNATEIFQATASGGTITANFAPQWTIKGSMSNDDWSTFYNLDYVSSNSFIGTIDLSVGSYEFKVVDRRDNVLYGCDATIDKTTTDYGFSTGEPAACRLTISEAGTYVFGWNSSTNQLSIIYPADQSKATLAKQSIVYFDVDGETYWNSGTWFPRFWFKNYATAQDIGIGIDATQIGSSTVYYAQVPDNDYVGRIQLNRIVNDNVDGTANVAYAYIRTNANQNCLTKETGKTDYKDSWTPQWTTYCPPMSSVTLSDNSTTVIPGTTGDGGEDSPFVVATGTDLQVTASATSAVDDANMTKMFNFKVDDTSQQNSDAYTYTKSSATSSGVTTYQIKVDAYNTYNSTDGTALTSSILYYEVHNAYTVTYNKGAYGKEDNTSATKYHAIDLTLPGVTFTRAGYTQTGWATSDGGAKAYDLGATYSANEAQNLYPVWEENRYHFTATSDNKWSTKNNWSAGELPTINDIVYIDAPVVVDSTDARAKKVIIDQSSTKTGKITINPGTKLVVAKTVTKTTDGSNSLTTAPEDLVFNSDTIYGLGALVTGELSANQATVNFCTKSHGTSGSSESVAQYLGTPFTDATVLSDFYNSWVYETYFPDNMGNLNWRRVEGPLNSFQGYCVISADPKGHSYEMQGTLTTEENKEVSLFCNDDDPDADDDSDTFSYQNENMFANSWMAPIKISNFTTSQFETAGAYGTIYIFNSGSKKQYEKNEDGNKMYGSGPAQYNTYTVGTAEDAIIPSMQAFSVFSKGSKSKEPVGSLTLNYDQLVYNPALAGTVPGPNKAPRRNNMIADEAGKMYVYVSGESGYRDRVYLWQHEDFTDGFENGWDGHKLFGESIAPQLYAQTPDGKMAVNCAPEFDGTILGFTKGSLDNTYTFRFAPQTDEVLYLNDMRTQTSTLINAENTYTFTAGEDDSARFLISRTPYPKMPTGVSDTQVSSSKARKIFINGQLYVLNGNALFDITGKRVNVQ